MPPRLLLDTHVPVRWLSEARKLSREQLRAIEAAVRRNESVALSAVSLLEIAMLVSDGRLRLGVPLDRFFLDIEANPVFDVLPLTHAVALEAAMVGNLRDPMDRAIAATARAHRLTLVTSDQRIADSQLVPVIE